VSIHHFTIPTFSMTTFQSASRELGYSEYLRQIPYAGYLKTPVLMKAADEEQALYELGAVIEILSPSQRSAFKNPKTCLQTLENWPTKVFEPHLDSLSNMWRLKNVAKAKKERLADAWSRIACAYDLPTNDEEPAP
jgi:hypothetical protein